MATIDTEKIITTRDFAEALGLHVDSVKRMCKEGKLDAEKVGGKFGIWMIEKTEVARYRKERRGPGRPPSDK